MSTDTWTKETVYYTLAVLLLGAAIMAFALGAWVLAGFTAWAGFAWVRPAMHAGRAARRPGVGR